MDVYDEDFVTVMGLITLVIPVVAQATVKVVKLAAQGSLLRDKVYKIPNFLEEVVPNMLPDQFKRWFRLAPSTVQKLIDLMYQSDRMQRRETENSIPPWKKVYMALYYLGHDQSTYLSAQLFNVCEETYLRAVDDVMLTLIDNMEEFIKWPEKWEYPSLAAQFDCIGRWLPNVIGCLDGCHLKYQVGQALNNIYYNGHKHLTSINLMAICTYNLAFMDIFVGWPGKSHDSKVFANSPIYNRIRGFMEVLGRPLSETFSVLADKAFPLSPEIITPFKPVDDVPLTQEQWNFNTHMNSKRQTIERAFSLLKRRFKRLRLLNQKSHEKAVQVVMAACILHNIAILEDDNVQFFLNSCEDAETDDMTHWEETPLHEDEREAEGNLKRTLLAEAVDRYTAQYV